MNVGHVASPLIAPDWRSLASYDAGRRGRPPHQFSSNWLFGFDGEDVFYSRAGNDYIYGGAGNDVFYFAKGYGLDTIGDFAAGAASGDLIQLQASGATGLGAAFDTFAEIFAAAVQVSANTVIALDGANRLTLAGATKANLTADDFMIL
jgi:Ca2+-binding RTX toxin-like protein